MNNQNRSSHIATSPKAKQEVKKFKEEFSEDLPWDNKSKGKYRK